MSRVKTRSGHFLKRESVISGASPPFPEGKPPLAPRSAKAKLAQTKVKIVLLERGMAPRHGL
jgi:hypothetical protein